MPLPATGDKVHRRSARALLSWAPARAVSPRTKAGCLPLPRSPLSGLEEPVWVSAQGPRVQSCTCWRFLTESPRARCRGWKGQSSTWRESRCRGCWPWCRGYERVAALCRHVMTPRSSGLEGAGRRCTPGHGPAEVERRTRSGLWIGALEPWARRSGWRPHLQAGECCSRQAAVSSPATTAPQLPGAGGGALGRRPCSLRSRQMAGEGSPSRTPRAEGQRVTWMAAPVWGGRPGGLFPACSQHSTQGSGKNWLQLMFVGKSSRKRTAARRKPGRGGAGWQVPGHACHTAELGPQATLGVMTRQRTHSNKRSRAQTEGTPVPPAAQPRGDRTVSRQGRCSLRGSHPHWLP